MSDEVASLRLEVATLREDLASLESEVRRLRQSLVGLRAEVSAEASLAGSVSQISEGDRSSSYTQVATPTAPGASVRSSGSTRPPVSAACLGRVVLSWADREAVCRRIGEWVRRCLEGQFRGPSGRDRIPLQSRFWVVARAIDNTEYYPPLVFSNWSSAKTLVKIGAQTGDSIFYGVLSKREAQISVDLFGPGTFWHECGPAHAGR